MPIFVFIDTNAQGAPTNYALQAASYASELAAQLQTECVGITSENSAKMLAALGVVGVAKACIIPSFCALNGDPLCSVFEELAGKYKPQAIIFPHDLIGKIIAPKLSAKLNAGLVVCATSLPKTDGTSWLLKRTAFSGKVSQTLCVAKGLRIITVQPNVFKIVEQSDIVTKTETLSLSQPLPPQSLSLIEKKMFGDDVSLADAEKVISGGMGMQSPNNWHLLEELAKKMGAALACTRLVSDAGWRPHHEHVGQTGTTIAPRLYIAVGISGAIQHVAGVSQSNVIVAINKDAEAPIFKIADYAIVGDALEVLPRLIKACP